MGTNVQAKQISQYILLVLMGSLGLLKSVGGDPRAQIVNLKCSNQLEHNSSIFAANFVVTMENISEQMAESGFGTAVTGSGPDANYGLAQCHGDLSLHDCELCYTEARTILPQCYPRNGGRILLDGCFIRTENYSFFEEYTGPSDRAVCDNTRRKGSDFQGLAREALTYAVPAALENEGYATAQVKNPGTKESAYVLVNCWRTVNDSACIVCLNIASASVLGCLPWSEGRALNTGCFIRYSDTDFLNEEPKIRISRGEKGVSSQRIIKIIVPAISFLVFSSFICCVLGWNRRKKIIAHKMPNDGSESMAKLLNLKFDLRMIITATNNFAKVNEIGVGGFGSVYKGILPSGQEIAVKRLSRHSGQGAQEFQNEVLVLNKLQHRNLVKLLGYCLEGTERMLIYEFVPNKSLDLFIFDAEKQRQMDWPKRYNIIKEIARGLLYLHSDSRPKIIHRDLKASNILLDEDMMPKISDFGMAKIFEENRTQECTNRVVGTLGYMSPEYVVHGRFSEKSDIFAFGILMLEIVSGKKNTSFCHSEYAENLLTYAWRHWRDGIPMELMDSTLQDSYVSEEVLTCIHIGLLCVQENPNARPTMAKVNLMLSSSSVSLPSPQRIAFFFGSVIRTPMISSTTTNEVSISSLLPR